MNGIGFSVKDPKTLRFRIENKSIPEPNTGCWLWTGAAADRLGYGRIFCEGVLVGAHRASKACCVGTINDGEKVLHTCDTPACVNPDHLIVSTSAANYADMIRKGRAKHFGPNKRPRVTECQAMAIVADKRSPFIIAEELGVSYSAVYNVRRGHTFGHVTGLSKAKSCGSH